MPIKGALVGYVPSERYFSCYGPIRHPNDLRDQARLDRLNLLKKHAPTQNHVKVFELVLRHGLDGHELLKASGLVAKELDDILLWLSDEEIHQELKEIGSELYYIWGVDHLLNSQKRWDASCARAYQHSGYRR